MDRGLAAESESHRHHGFEVVNMESEVDDSEKKHDEGYQMDHEEVESLFKNLDKNNDGRIDVNELAEGLKHLHGSRYKAGQAQVRIKDTATNTFCRHLLQTLSIHISLLFFCRFETLKLF